MNQSKNLLFFGSFVIFVGLMWLSLQTCGDTNSVSATPSPTPSPTPAPTAAPSKKKQGAAVATPAPTATPSRPSRVILTTPYVIQDRSTDVRTNAIEQQQQVTTQEMTAVRQELDALNGSVRWLIDKESTRDVNDPSLLSRFNRIERMLGSLNERLKKLEDRVDQQSVKIRKLKNAQDAAPIATEPNDVNAPAAK